MVKTRKNIKPNFKLKKGDLTKYGYRLTSSRQTRRKALRMSKKEFTHATLIRKLNALAILHKNKNKKYSKKARDDMSFLRNIRKP